MVRNILKAFAVIVLVPLVVLVWTIAYAIALVHATLLVPFTALHILYESRGREKGRQSRRSTRGRQTYELTPEQREQARRFGL